MGDDEYAWEYEASASSASTSRPFAANLRHLREAKGMTQAEFAALMAAQGMDQWRQQTVTRVENGHRGVSLDEAQTAAKILGTTIDRMIRATAELEAITLANAAEGRLGVAVADGVEAIARLYTARRVSEQVACEAASSSFASVRKAAVNIAEILLTTTLQDVLTSAEVEYMEPRENPDAEPTDWAFVVERAGRAAYEDDVLPPDLVDAMRGSEEGLAGLEKLDHLRRRVAVAEYAGYFEAEPQRREELKRFLALGREMFGERGPATQEQIDQVVAHAREQGITSQPFVMHRIADGELQIVDPADAASPDSADRDGA